VDAAPEQLKEAIEMVPLLVAKLPTVSPVQQQPAALQSVSAEPIQEEASVSSVPAISVEKSDSLADVIGKFFSVPWGRDKRKLLDVREALQSYGLNYPKQSVAVALLRLAKSSKIRRFKAEDGEYVYTATSLIPPVELVQRNTMPIEEFASSSAA
jgi:hypothetical protein